MARSRRRRPPSTKNVTKRGKRILKTTLRRAEKQRGGVDAFLKRVLGDAKLSPAEISHIKNRVERAPIRGGGRRPAPGAIDIYTSRFRSNAARETFLDEIYGRVARDRRGLASGPAVAQRVAELMNAAHRAGRGEEARRLRLEAQQLLLRAWAALGLDLDDLPDEFAWY